MTLEERDFFDILAEMETPALVRRGEKIIYANPAAEEIFGRDLRNAHVSQVLPEELTREDGDVPSAKVTAGGVELEAGARRIGDMTLITAHRSAEPTDEARTLAASLVCAVWEDLSICAMSRDLVIARARETGDLASITYLTMLDRALHAVTRVVYNTKRVLGDGFEKDFKFYSVDLGELVGDVITTSAALAHHRGVKFVFKPPEEQIIYRVDTEKAELMLMELISNSLRHTGEGGKITVSVRKNRAGALITVADTGDGFKGEALDHTFSRYSRPKSSQEKRPGAGMGLALAELIAQGHGGRIILGGTDEGASVTVSLPASGLVASGGDIDEPVPHCNAETFLTQYADVLDSAIYADRPDM